MDANREPFASQPYEVQTMNTAAATSTVTVNVYIPKSTEALTYTWPMTTPVGTAARQVADEHGIDIEFPTFQTSDGDVLDPGLTFAAAGIKEGDCLDLVGAGGGV